MIAMIHFWKKDVDFHYERYDDVTSVIIGKENIEIRQKTNSIERNSVYHINDAFQYLEIREKDLFSKGK